ncbi:hypothetical protein [Ectopseudomonas khazarica]|uniref:hypothetical protein n=1 Tax=Ectopseudomonas khazarica TaxID=2502979 RepID=UPI003B941135
MKNNKRGKPSLLESEKRTNKILVALNAEEYERLLEIMDEKGFDSPAVFLRSSGLRSELPPKVVIEQNRKDTYTLLSTVVKALDQAKGMNYPASEMHGIRNAVANIAKKLLQTKGDQA